MTGHPWFVKNIFNLYPGVTVRCYSFALTVPGGGRVPMNKVFLNADGSAINKLMAYIGLFRFDSAVKNVEY